MGTASDNDAVQNVELSTDGVNWVLADGTTTWSRTLDLVVGPNTIHVRATDTAGNRATGMISVTVAPSGPSPLLIGGVVAGIAGVALAAMFLLRRRKHAP